MKSDADVQASRDDSEMMKRDHLWPQLVLPLKRRADGGGWETAILDDPCPPAERWMIRVGANLMDPTKLGRPVFYDSAEAIVADGWVVD